MMRRWSSTTWKRTAGRSFHRSWRLEDTPFLLYLSQGDDGIAHHNYYHDDLDSGDDDDCNDDEDVVNVNIWPYIYMALYILYMVI